MHEFIGVNQTWHSLSLTRFLRWLFPCRRCVAASASDYVEVSNYMAVDRKMPRYCGQLKDVTSPMESDGPFFRVTFKSNDRFDGTGFFAIYQFTPVADAIMTTRHRGSTAARHPGKLPFFFFVFFFDSSRLKFFFQINLIWFVSTGSRLFALFVWVLSYLLSQWAEKMTWLQAIVKEGEFPKGKWNIICDEWPLCPGLFCSLVCYIYLLFPQYDSCSFSCVMRVICSIKGFYIIF